MIIPEKLKIIGFDWTVEKNDKSKDVTYQGSCYGSTHQGTQKIFLNPDDPIQKSEQVLIHEIMHAIWWQMGLNERYKKEKDIEEEVITTISQGLYQVLKDNDMLK